MGRGGGGDAAAGDGDAASVGGSTITSGGTRTNNAGDSNCYHCGGEGHWANKCPELAEEQQAQLHMTVEGTGKGDKEAEETAQQYFHASMVQGEELTDWQAYLNGCSTVTVFKSKKHLKNIRLG